MSWSHTVSARPIGRRLTGGFFPYHGQTGGTEYLLFAHDMGTIQRGVDHRLRRSLLRVAGRTVEYLFAFRAGSAAVIVASRIPLWRPSRWEHRDRRLSRA